MNPNFFNLSKRKKRNLLFELLAGTPSEGVISKKELKALERLIAKPSEKNNLTGRHDRRQQTNKLPAVRKKKKEKKRKTTIYVSEDVFQNLNRATERIRSAVPEGYRFRITKSQIINQALAIILQEYHAKGKKSRLVENISQEISL